MIKVIVNNEELWIKKNTKIEIKDKTNWAKLRIKKDAKTGKDYIDTLVGAKGKQWHAHIGWNLDQTLLFTRYRGITRSIERNVESLKKGHLENKKVVIDPSIKPVKTTVLELNIVGSTKEVKIIKFQFE